MRNFIPAFSIILCCLIACPIQARKKNKNQSHDEMVLAMIEPDQMVMPSLSHDIVEPIEEAYQHDITSTKNRYGIDVSRYQGRIDWETVKTDQNVSYVYLKATEGASLVDNTYYYNLREARKAGIKVGCYHFFSPSIDPATQFENFSNVVQLTEHDLIPIIDVENRGKGSIESFRNRLSKFLNMVEKYYGIQPIIYTSSNFYNKYLAGKYTGYKYMIARYKDEVPELTDNDVKFVMWQFTANGKINGIKGSVDRSRFMENYHIGDIMLRK